MSLILTAAAAYGAAYAGSDLAMALNQLELLFDMAGVSPGHCLVYAGRELHVFITEPSLVHSKGSVCRVCACHRVMMWSFHGASSAGCSFEVGTRWRC
ncbi:unnamed protein product [Symbiodinium microadriaticum]|nr:unnamed protein product [Symbiodinium microadriaticum]